MWVTSGPDGVNLAKAVFKTASELRILAQMEGNGRVSLHFIAPAPGTYEIRAANTLESNAWETATVFTNVTGTVSWADPAPGSQSRFYRVIQR